MENNYSVLMSVYFKEKAANLNDAVLSVMNQTVAPNDFVLVCDGPLNEELDVKIEELVSKFPIINVIRLEENKGLGDALAFGITKTKNEIVMRMDSDDLCMANRAEIQLPLMSKYDIVGGYISEFEDKPTNIIGFRKPPVESKEIYKYAKVRNPFNHPSVIYKKSIVMKAGNYQKMPFYEDYYLWVRALQITNKVYNVPEVLVNMRSGVQMRARRANKAAKKSVKILRKYMHKIHMISWFSYAYYTLLYKIILSMPRWFVTGFYSKVLRKKSK